MRSFTVLGKPQGKGRPRASSRGKFVRMYTPKNTRDYEQTIRESYLEAYESSKPLEGYIKAYLILYYPIPKSTSKANKAKMLDKTLLPDKKPDIDNCIKGVFDSLNGIAFVDDKQIVKLVAEKYYSENPRIYCELSEI